MQIVIDIPEEEYQNILLTGKASFCTVNAIEAGTPLPKGHGRLIDADALENVWHEEFLKGMNISAGMVNVFNDAPTIIEADKAEGGK